MTQQFFENIDIAYRALENLIDKSREVVFSHTEVARIVKDNIPILLQSGETQTSCERESRFQRVCLNLVGIYAVKVTIGDTYIIGDVNFSVFDVDLRYKNFKYEERNYQVLSDYGFTRENGFNIPQHKVVGINIVGNKAQVDPDGDGWTIVEDATEGGAYAVSEIYPWTFALLRNRGIFVESYWWHMNKLMELYNNPNVDVDLRRHDRPKNPWLPLSRMLLVKEKDNIGEIVIGDLDNLEFIVKSNTPSTSPQPFS